MSLEHAHDVGEPGRPMHEERDADTRTILELGIGLALSIVVVGVAVWALLASLSRQDRAAQPPQSPAAVEQQNRLPLEPRLQTSPRQDMRDLRAAAEETLTSYGWVDRANGIVRIPIEEAMKLTIERGLPARSQ